jgi:hypothetical protein
MSDGHGCTALVSVPDVAPGEAALLADSAKDHPGLSHGPTVAPVLVRLAELTALVLPMRGVRHVQRSVP